MTLNTKKSVAIVGIVMTIVMVASIFMFTACNDDEGNGGNGVFFNNESDPLVFSTLELDKVFNPFFSTSATDSNVVGMTQIGMIGNDKAGNPVVGDDEAVVVKDMQIIQTGTPEVDQKTEYRLVLKNNVRFSNGSYLSMKDVLFNLYVYLDPAYTGSSTIYSTDIVGLKEYRTQAASETEQDAFMAQFETEAAGRMSTLISACAAILDEDPNILPEEMKDAIVAYQQERSDLEAYDHIVDDYAKAIELFGEELEQDYSNSLNSYQDQVFKDEDGTIYKNLFTTDIEMFLYNEGYITWNKREGKLHSALATDQQIVDGLLKQMTKEEAIQIIIEDKIPAKIEEVLMFWNTSVTLNDFIVKEEMEEYSKANEGRLTYTNISGIKFANRTEPVTVNGVEYGVPTYVAGTNNTQVESGHEVLSVTINDVDPKAIWNLAFTVAPMYYYSNQEQIDLFDYENHFGVEYMSQSFMNNVVKDPNKIGVPVGAGPYAASKSSGGLTGVAAGDFYNLGIIYYERNPYYVMGPAKINKVRYKVVASTQILNSLYNNEIDFADPSSKPETIAELNGKKDQGIGNKSIRTSGYGYIGINAGKVPSIQVRQAIMHSINTAECVSYYKGTASAIHRSMSLSNWAYPGYDANADNEGDYGTTAPTAYYPYIAGPVPENLNTVNPRYADFVEEKGKSAGESFTQAEQDEFILGLLAEAGYTMGGDGIYANGSDKLKYTFTIAGEEIDHPAYSALFHASEILNRNGFSIIVKTDANALRLLASGGLTVWAAAWGSTIDPDMYQVYHKESQATSVLNWGYKQILQNNGGKYNLELALVEDLSDIIDKARKTEDKEERAAFYSQALDIVMELAIELPTYQRDDLFAYNTNKIDVTSFTPDSELSPFKGLTADLHLVSLVTEK